MRMLDSFGSFHFGRLAFGTSIHNLARILESLTSTPLAHKKCMFWTVMRSALGESSSTHTCERVLSYRIVVATLCHIILRKCLPLVASRLGATQKLSRACRLCSSTPPSISPLEAGACLLRWALGTLGVLSLSHTVSREIPGSKAPAQTPRCNIWFFGSY